MTHGLLTDHYELTMLQAARRSGTAERRCVFEVFARSLPAGRRYGVLAGTGRILDTLADFRFDEDDLAYLADHDVVDDGTLDYLASYRFGGSITAYEEGELYFPHSPVLRVEGTFAESVLLETYLLSVLNYDSAVAAAGSRMVFHAGGRPLIEMGARRVHEQASVAAARAAYIVGFGSTSDLEAGRSYGIPTGGTAAHAFVLLHDSEREAFQAQVDSMTADTTILIDTYDIEQAVRTAIDVAGPNLSAVRLDSGNLCETSVMVRRVLDELGATGTRIVATSDLDEYAIHRFRDCPIDVFGVGTRLVTGVGAPTATFVYKLIEREGADGVMEPVAKKSVGKVTVGGRKDAVRELDDSGIAVREVLFGEGRESADLVPNGRRLQVPLVEGGRILDDLDAVGRVDAARNRHRRSLEELGLDPAVAEVDGEVALPTVTYGAGGQDVTYP